MEFIYLRELISTTALRLLGFEIFGMNIKFLKISFLIIFNIVNKGNIVEVESIGFGYSLTAIIKIMATNSGKDSRKGAVKNRSQVFNPTTGNYIKRDTQTGKFIDVKSDGKPFKGVRKESITIKANPNVKKDTAKKSESAVIKVRNNKKGGK